MRTKIIYFIILNYIQKDHDKELIKRALAKQANKDAIEYQKLLKKKNEEIEQLNIRLQQSTKVKRK